jgi:peptide/nickel transport system substrate-binding protein
MKKTALLSASALIAAFAVAPASAQKAASTLRMPLTEPIVGISYYLDPKPETVFETEAVFDNLIVFNEKDFKFEPLLAKSWKQIDDNTLEFQLRDDIKWHDGQPFSADDVVSTLNWTIDPKTTNIRFKGNWEFIDRVEKTGPNTVRVISKQPTPYALTRLAYLTSIEAAHAHGKAEDKVVYSAGKPVGTGPYRVVNIDRNKGIFLERNPDFKHGTAAKSATNVDKINMLFIPDGGTRIAQFLVHNLDMVRDPTLSNAEDMAKTPGVTFSMGQGTSYMYMAIDAKGRSGNKALTDVRVRRALMMAINRKDILKFLADGHPMREPENMCWKFQAGCDYTKGPYPFDPAGAKKLLAEAGYADGFDLEITTFTNESIKGMAQILANQLNTIGVRATVQPTELGAYRKKQTDGKIQVQAASWPGGGNADVQGTMEFIYAVPDSRDYSGDQEMVADAFKTLTIMDPEARKAAGRKIFDRSTEMAYFTPVGPSPALVVHSTDLSVEPGAFSAYSINPQNIHWN